MQGQTTVVSGFRPMPQLALTMACAFVGAAASPAGQSEAGGRALRGDEPMPRIRVADGTFVEADTARRFVPMGFNFNRLRPHHQNPKVLWHDNFNPGRYRQEEVDALFSDLRTHGFNVVRVFLDHMDEARGGIGSKTDTTGLSRAYLSNLVDFLARARSHGVYVILCPSSTPVSKRYRDIIASHRVPEGFGQLVRNANLLTMHPGHVAAHAAYMADVARAIKRRDRGLLSTVFAFEATNEAYQIAAAPPFSLGSGAFELNGRAYDLGNEESLQSLADDSVVDWVDACGEAVRSVDPEAMVSVNVFTFAAVNRTGPGHVRRDRSADPRIPARPLALAQRSAIDYLDIHLYMHYVENESVRDGFADDLATVEYDQVRAAASRRGMPIIMGEFGAFIGAFGSVVRAAPSMAEQTELAFDAGFQGFLYWTYDCHEQGKSLFHAKSADGLIFGALAGTVGRVVVGDGPTLRVKPSLGRPRRPDAEHITPVGPNLVSDGGFEEARADGTPTRWRTAAYGKTTLEDIVIAVEPQGEGAEGAVLRISAPNLAAGQAASVLGEPFAAEPGRRYVVEFRARSAAPRTPIRFFLLDEGFQWVRERKSRLRPEWKAVREVVATDELQSGKRIYFRIDLLTGGDVWLDHVSVRLAESTPGGH